MSNNSPERVEALGLRGASTLLNVWGDLASHALDRMLVVAPDPDWVRTLPNAKLPDRTDFTRYGQDLAARVKVWSAATRASVQLAEEFEAWLARPDLSRVESL